MLVHQAVLLGIGRHALGHVRAANLRTLGLAQEDVQILRHILGNLERGGAARYIRRAGLYLAVLAALAGILHRASDLLLQTLHLSEQRGDGVAHR